jgi:uncharacterized membrane protein
MASRDAPRAFGRYDLRQARGRLALAVAAGVAVAWALDSYGWAVSVLGGWDAGSATFLALAWAIIWRADARETGRRAGAEDPGRTVVGVVVVLASAMSLVAATKIVRHAQIIAPAATDALVALCLSAVALAWFLTHSIYTLRYARLYYREDDEGVGGLEFPGKNAPADLDFAYFAFTVGMCFQVSDVVVTSPTIRRAVLFHAIVSFAYNTTLLALVLNLVFGLFS